MRRLLGCLSIWSGLRTGGFSGSPGRGRVARFLEPITIERRLGIPSKRLEAEPMSYQHLLLSLTDGVAHITLNRPEKHNALSRALIDELHAALGELEASEEVRAL